MSFHCYCPLLHIPLRHHCIVLSATHFLKKVQIRTRDSGLRHMYASSVHCHPNLQISKKPLKSQTRISHLRENLYAELFFCSSYTDPYVRRKFHPSLTKVNCVSLNYYLRLLRLSWPIKEGLKVAWITACLTNSCVWFCSTFIYSAVLKSFATSFQLFIRITLEKLISIPSQE